MGGWCEGHEPLGECHIMDRLLVCLQMARHSLISAARRAIADRRSSGVASGLPQEWLYDNEWGLGREAPLHTPVLNSWNTSHDTPHRRQEKPEIPEYI